MADPVSRDALDAAIAAAQSDPLRQMRDALDPPALRALREQNRVLQTAVKGGALDRAREASLAIDRFINEINGRRSRFRSPEHAALEAIYSFPGPPRGTRAAPPAAGDAIPSASPQPGPLQKSQDPVRRVGDIGQLVKAARKDMKLNQQRFADLAGVGRRFLSELEAGKPTLEMGRVLDVCQAAGIDIAASRR